MPNAVVISADQIVTVALAPTDGSATVAAGVTVHAPETPETFAIDARNGVGGRIAVYGKLISAGGIYDPTSTRDGYDIFVDRDGSITATNGYGIALQNKATVINHGTISATNTGISTGSGQSTIVNTGLVQAATGIIGYGDLTVIDNGGTVNSSFIGIDIAGDLADLTNSGFIHSDREAVVMASGTGTHMTFTNTGTVQGATHSVLGWRGADEVVNRGLLSGGVDLNTGNDLFDNRQGIVVGIILLHEGNDTMRGGAGSETVIDWLGDDSVDGGDGVDTLSYEFSTDATRPARVDLHVSARQDTGWGMDAILNIENVTGSAANDTITGSDGVNALKGLSGSDSLSGAGGADTIEGGAGNDVLDGGAGIDTARYASDAIVTVDLRLTTIQDTGMGRDILLGIENVEGGSAGDWLNGNAGANALAGAAGNDLLVGEAGDDVLDGGAGDDRLQGGDGTDTASFSGSRDSYAVEAHADGSVTVTDLRPDRDGQDILTGIEVLRFGDSAMAVPAYAPPSAPAPMILIGTAAGESLAAGAGNDRIKGLSGNDVLSGLGGSDTLSGGVGRDTLAGGDGSDVFMFDAKPARTKIDRIADFTIGMDSLWLDNAIFKSNKALYRLVKKGTEANPMHMKKAFVVLSDHAKDANDYFILDRRKGILSYDADGSGAGHAIGIATFKKGLKMSYHDLFFV